MNDFKQRYPQYAAMVHRIYNPVDVNEICNAATDAPVFPGKYFVQVSRLSVGKDIPTLLAAYQKFWHDNNRPDVKLVIVGDGPMGEQWRADARQMDCADNIVFVGTVTNPFGYIKNAIANIFATEFEGFGMVVVEGAALRTLNIAADCTYGPREILLNGRGGLLFDVGDADALGECMSRVYRGDVDVRAMTDAAADGLARFEVKNIVDQILSLVRTVKSGGCKTGVN